MQQPIIMINAEHDVPASVGKATESCRKLAPRLYSTYVLVPKLCFCGILTYQLV